MAKLFPVRFRTALKLGFIAAGVAVVVTLYVFAHRSGTSTKESVSNASFPSGKLLQVEVLDGVGNMKIAQRMTDALRRAGYDVVEMKKNSEGIAEKSIIFDRAGNLEAAKKLAQEVGIPENKVFQKIDNNLFLDITIVVGRDYLTLTASHSLHERSLP